MPGVDVAHRHRSAHRGAVAAAGDGADAPALGVGHLGVLARRRPALGAQADAAARRSLGELALDDGGAGEAARGAASARDRPRQPGLDRRRRRIDVMAVEAQPGLEPEAVARAQSGGLDLGLADQAAGERLGGALGGRDLEAVLAGVARTADEALDAGHRHHRCGHEAQPRAARRVARERGGRRRPLQREQRAVRVHLDRDAVQARAQMREVVVLARGVDDQEQMVAGVGHQQVVEDAAAVVGEQGVAHGAGGEAGDVGGNERLQRARRALAAHADLSHVGDVEQHRPGAGVQVLGEDAGGILHRHLVARERHHPGAQLDVQVVKRGASERKTRGVAHGVLQQPRGAAVNRYRLGGCPLCLRT